MRIFALHEGSASVVQESDARQSAFSETGRGQPMLSLQQLRDTLILVLDHAMPACAEVEHRLVGTSAALLQGVPLPAGDIDILVKERPSVDAFGAALASYKCLFAPAWMPHSGQYYAEYDVNGVGVQISTVEGEIVSDAIECLGSGPWEHYVLVPCGPYTIPAVGLELRLTTELARDRPDRFKPLIQHMRAHGCDIELVRRGMEARTLPQALQEHVLDQLQSESAG
jgi:hypothetical protein